MGRGPQVEAMSDEKEFRRRHEILEREVALLRDAIDRSNTALEEAVKTKEERDKLALQNRELQAAKDDLEDRFHKSAANVADLVGKLEQSNRLKDEMANHAARLRVCLLRYGTHYPRCAVYPEPSGKDCDCGYEANVQAVPGEKVSTPEVKRNDVATGGMNVHAKGGWCSCGKHHD